MYLKLLLAVLSLASLAGCMTRREAERQKGQVFMMGWIHGQESCTQDLIEYNKFLFGDRVEKAKKKELKDLLSKPGRPGK